MADWTDPGAVEEAADVWRIPLPLPTDALRAVNVYAVRDGDGVVLVDAGWALARAQDVLVAGLAEIGLGLSDVREFLVTHVHRDHYTQAVAIRRTHGTPVALGAGERQGLERLAEYIAGTRTRDFSELRRCGAAPLVDELRRTGLGPVDSENWGFPDRWLTDGLDVPLAGRTLRVVETPGHTRGHVVFHDGAAGLLFAGDHVLPHITPSIGVEVPPSPSALRDFLASLARVRALPDARVLPAHGPVTDSVHARVDELLDHHERRLTATAEAVGSGASTAYEAARVLRWTRRGRAFTELDLGNQVLATTETAAHLEALVARGWLAVDETDGVLHHRRP